MTHVMRLFADLGLEIRRVVRGTTDEHTKFRRRLATTILVTLVVDAIGSVLMYVFEYQKHGSISSPFKSFFWVTAQLLTVSSQMPNPLTTGGRIVDIFLEIWAITVVATVAASFTAFLQKK